MKECNQCGACCKTISIPAIGMSVEGFAYCVERGLEFVPDQKLFLVPHICTHLTIMNTCDIYEKRPKLCRDFRGKRQRGRQKYYVPPECSMQ